MKTFTVVGYYEGCGLKYLGHFECEGPKEAMELAAETSDELVFVAVLEGHHDDQCDGEYCSYAEDHLTTTDEERSYGPIQGRD